MGRNLKLFFSILLVVFLVGAYLFFNQIQREYVAITTFQECIDAGYQVTGAYPEQCKIPGKVFTNTKQEASVDIIEATTSPEKNMNPKNSSYDIEGHVITLQNGESITSDQILESSAKKIVKYFGNELRVDIDGDTKEDTAFLLTTNNSGTGTFYYLVVALNKDGGYIGTNGVFIGDRIAPQTTEFRNGEIVVNYTDRKIDEPMSAKPTLGISRYFKVMNDTLVEIIK